MVTRDQTHFNDATSAIVVEKNPANETTSIVTAEKPEQHPANSAMSPLSAQNSKNILLHQIKDEQRRKAEVKQKETDDRFTSPAFLQVIRDIFGDIDFDPCWHEASAVMPKAYLDVREGHNGLRDEWLGKFIYVNPPWSAQDRWLRRAHDQWSRYKPRTIVCLVPAKTDTKFFHQTLIKDADIYFIKGRSRFFKCDRTYEATKVATMLVIFGATAQQKLQLSERVSGAWFEPNRSYATADVTVASTPSETPELAWTATQMRAEGRIVINADLIAAYQAASSPHSIRALKSDLEAFDLWCRRMKRVALPATPEIVADYLDARAGRGAKPASLGRYKASIAKIHKLLDLIRAT